jgi:acyl-[acyl-carrier-protein]-phospholipid O-acyltransferase/long-chain-fatty-acid--[acyl-carrier-protein] ligase
LHQVDLDDPMTVIFTSGSTGMPKGVMLSYRNVGSNIEAINRALHLRRDDVLMGILPMFHSFGYTVTLWTVLTLDPKGAYHYTPLEAREVGRLVREHRGTLLIGTPTFLRSYIRRCQPEDFASLEIVVVGAEKMPLDLAESFERKFGVRPVEGYGTTELSPVVSVNIPPSRAASDQDLGVREGTIGCPLPGIEAKVVHLDSGEDLGPNEEGMLLIRGPNVMLGYMNHPEWTAESIRDGWYVTGDVARIDRDGYITITGRQSRFSKIGGEMVPHLRVEEAIGDVLRAEQVEPPDDESDAADHQVAVTSLPDEKKGERLIVLHTGIPKDPDDVRRALRDSGLPPLWIPAAENFRQVDEIPILGSGKLDLKALRERAEREFGHT